MWVRVDVWLEGFMSRVLWVLGGLQMFSGWSASGREATTGTQGFCVRNKENTTDAHVFLRDTRSETWILWSLWGECMESRASLLIYWCAMVGMRLGTHSYSSKSMRAVTTTHTNFVNSAPSFEKYIWAVGSCRSFGNYAFWNAPLPFGKYVCAVGSRWSFGK